MEKLEKTLRYTKLYYLYKSQLSVTQQEMMNDYYFLDLSLSEIAENKGVSRSAVEDAIKKSEKKLEELEDNLHFLEKQENLKSQLETLKTKALNNSEIEEIERMEKELDNGI